MATKKKKATSGYVAGRQASFGHPNPDDPEGPQIIETFAPGDPVPNDFETTDGLLLNGYIVKAEEYQPGMTYRYDEATGSTVAEQIVIAESGE